MTTLRVVLFLAAAGPLCALGSGESRESRETVSGLPSAPTGVVEQSAATRDRPPAFSERIAERTALVRDALSGQGISNGEVLEAMRTVPRHRFVPRSQTARAYLDRALPIGYGQTISQPYVVAFMTEALELNSADKVLEIGTGSGYQAAVLAEIVTRVWSIEIVEELYDEVTRRLGDLGYRDVRVAHGDGYFGWEEEAPFDKMIVTAAVDHVPPALLNQLAPGGKLILPLGPPGGIQTLLLITRQPDGRFERSSLLAVRFVPLTGAALR